MELEIPTFYGPYGDDTKDDLIDSQPEDNIIYQPTISQIFVRKSIKFSATSMGMENNPNSCTKAVGDISWQTQQKNMKNCFGYLLCTGLYSDVTFVIGQTEERLESHKLILMTRSPVFDAMFQRWETGKKPIIPLPHLELEHFKLFLQFMYTDEFPDVEEWPKPIPESSFELLKNAYRLGQYYQVSGLIETSGEALVQCIDRSNSVNVYELGTLYNCDKLKKSAYYYIRLYAADTLCKNEDFLFLSLDSLCSILNHDDLASNEIDVFNAVVRWAKNRCKSLSLEPTNSVNLRIVAEKAFHLVRFPTMEVSEFKTEVVEKYEGLLTEPEIIQVLFLLVEQEKLNKKGSNVSLVSNDNKSPEEKVSSCLPRMYSKLYFNTTPRQGNKEDEEEGGDSDDESEGESTEHDIDEGVYEDTETEDEEEDVTDEEEW